MRRRTLILLSIISLTLGLMLAACSGQAPADGLSESEEEGGTREEKAPGDPYEEYIKSAIASVDDNKASSDGEEEIQAEETEQPFNGKSIQIERTAPEKLYYSSMENSDTVNEPSPVPLDTSPTPTPSGSTDKNTAEEATPTPTGDPSGTPTPEPTPYITPDEFDVGTCCIYMNGESDSAYGTEVVTAINKAREDLGYKPFVSNKGLATCADRRTRELAAYYSHTRPNGQPFYSLAPEHFKAEILMVGTQEAADAVDTLIKKDPLSRSMIFTNKYKSIGASSFKCNGKECMVVAFGL